MVALLSPRPEIDATVTAGPVPPAPRPVLRVIDGGRSDAGRRAMARTYRRRRAVALVLALVVLGVAVRSTQAGLDVAAGWAAPSAAPIEGPTVVVEARTGDTLWSIARRVHPDSDVRPVVEAMVAARGTTAIDVGDDVAVPAG